MQKFNSLHFIVALLALAFIYPYFMWTHQSAWLIIIVLLLIGDFIFKFNYKYIIKSDIYWASAFCGFLAYLSLLYTTTHTHKGWFLLIPAMFILFTLPRKDKILSLECFSTIFALTLIPGITVWFLMLLDIPLSFSRLTPLSALKTQENIYYLKFFGAVFPNNVIYPLPNGGVIARVCAIYDEPGSVGTFAALLLISANRLNGLKEKWKTSLLIIGGILTFSFAFYMITLLGFLLSKNFRLFAFILISFLISTQVPYTPLSSLRPGSEQSLVLKKDKSSYYQNALDKFDNRTSLRMEKLFSTYLHGDISVLLFGIASNANSVYDGYSSTWKIILTNYGLIGLSYLIILLIGYAFTKNNSAFYRIDGYIFLFVFLLNIYQRPFVWIPSYMLIFLGTFAATGCKKSTEEKSQIERFNLNENISSTAKKATSL
ncbi:Uncharacterised protein [Legionella beliardensis]|uniref:Transmembrane protein n=1 Tax=Legionella beliardensis TaxID=91822 RepID=A0A378I3C3_9GAMM|nr:hypothetical protein [Legionella beliardensis]STX29186.1 Uncharacterised protein [Legionella beliardensis]